MTLTALGELPTKPLFMQYLHPQDLAGPPGLRAIRTHRSRSERSQRPSTSIQQTAVAAIWAGNVEMFGLSLHTTTEICQPFSDFKLDVLR